MYVSLQSSEADPCDDFGYVDYIKLSGWHHHIVASIYLYDSFSLANANVLVTMKLIYQYVPI
jgi:hypothetical protein